MCNESFERNGGTKLPIDDASDIRLVINKDVLDSQVRMLQRESLVRRSPCYFRDHFLQNVCEYLVIQFIFNRVDNMFRSFSEESPRISRRRYIFPIS